MGFFKKLFGKKEITPPSIPQQQDTGISIDRTENEITVSVDMAKTVAYVQSNEYKQKRIEEESPVFATEEQIDSLPLVETKSGKVRRIKCAIMPSSITDMKDGTYIAMCDVRSNSFVLFPNGKKLSNGTDDYFGDIYSKDLKKFEKFVGLQLPFIAYCYKDWDYFYNTKAYYDEERRCEITVYLGSIEEVKQAMKEDLALLNEKVKTDRHY